MCVGCHGYKRFLSILQVRYSGTACALGALGSKPGHGLSGDWASTCGSGSQMDGLSDRRSPLGGLL